VFKGFQTRSNYTGDSKMYTVKNDIKNQP